jgi:hypothetical protein
MDTIENESVGMQALPETSLCYLQNLMQTKIPASKNKRKEIVTIVWLSGATQLCFKK